MTATMPMVNDTDQLSISQAAEVLGIHRHTLRRHTEEGLIRCNHRRSSGRKFYLGKEIKRYWKNL